MKKALCLVIAVLMCIASGFAVAETESEPYSITFSWAQQILDGLTQEDIYSDVAVAAVSAVSLYLDIAMNKEISDVSSTNAGLLLKNELWIGKKDDIIIVGGYDDSIFDNAIFLFYNPATATATYRCEKVTKDYSSFVSSIMEEVSDEYYMIDKDIVQTAVSGFYSKLN